MYLSFSFNWFFGNYSKLFPSYSQKTSFCSFLLHAYFLLKMLRQFWVTATPILNPGSFYFSINGWRRKRVFNGVNSLFKKNYIKAITFSFYIIFFLTLIILHLNYYTNFYTNFIRIYLYNFTQNSLCTILTSSKFIAMISTKTIWD